MKFIGDFICKTFIIVTLRMQTSVLNFFCLYLLFKISILVEVDCGRQLVGANTFI